MTTAKEYTISKDNLRHYCGIAQNRYMALDRLLQNQIKTSAPDNPYKNELANVLHKYFILFSGIVQGVNKSIETDSTIIASPERKGLTTAYSLHVAARTVSKDLESMVSEGTRNAFSHHTIDIPTDEQFEWEKTTYSNIKKVFDCMSNYTINSRQKPTVALKEFFDNYCNMTNQEILMRLDPNLYANLKGIKWKISDYEIDGLKEIVTAKEEGSSTAVQQKENNQFYTPLEYMHIPKQDILPRNRIIGNQSIIDELEKKIIALFSYNVKEHMNPCIMDDDLYESGFVLEGMPGEGKGMVCYHVIDYAERLAKIKGVELVVTELSVDSSWQDGSILKLKSQFKQIANEDKVFLIFQDEVNRLIKKQEKNGNDSHSADVVLELQKFLSGTYANKGNYLFMGTTNVYSSLPKAIKSRLKPVSWKGAETAEQKATMYKFKLEKSIQGGYVNTSDDEFLQLGQLAYEHELSGREITGICKTVKRNSFRWDRAGAMLDARQGDIQTQLAIKNQLYLPFGFKELETETIRLINDKMQGKMNSDKYFEE